MMTMMIMMIYDDDDWSASEVNHILAYPATHSRMFQALESSVVVPRAKELILIAETVGVILELFMGRWSCHVLPMLHSKANSHTQKMCPQGIHLGV